MKTKGSIKIFTLLAIVMSLEFLSCNKQSNNRKSIPIQNDLKDNYSFKPGTYWIYKDSLSGRFDSFAVISNDTGSALGGGGTEFYMECKCYMDYINILVKQFEVSPVNQFFIGNWQTSLLSSVDLITTSDFSGPLFYSPVTVNQNTVNGYDVGMTTNIFPDYNLNGIIFNNVAEINHNDTSYPGPTIYNHVFYICPGIGMVKMNLFYPKDSTKYVWELQRYRIFQ